MPRIDRCDTHAFRQDTRVQCRLITRHASERTISLVRDMDVVQKPWTDDHAPITRGFVQAVNAVQET